jgi:hypothetical protein
MESLAQNASLGKLGIGFSDAFIKYLYSLELEFDDQSPLMLALLMTRPQRL